jgi:putative ABC transport system permease protein
MLKRSQRRSWIVLIFAVVVACEGSAHTLPPATEYSVSSMDLAAGPSTEPVKVATVTAEFFRVIGVQAALGRLLIDGEFKPGVAPTAVIANALWQRKFGGDPTIIGRPIQLGGQNVIVVGVAPSDVDFPPGIQVWLPRH